MPGHIGDRLPQRQPQLVLGRREQDQPAVVVHPQRYPGPGQRTPRRLQLRADIGLPPAGDRAAHRAQRLPRVPLDLLGLGAGPLRVGQHQLPGQLGAHHHRRQRMPEQVVQVARDPLAFRDGRHQPDLRAAQPLVLQLPPPVVLPDFEQTDHPDQHQRRPEAQQPVGDRHPRRQRRGEVQHGQAGEPPPCDVPRQGLAGRGRRVDEQHARVGVERRGQRADHDHRHDRGPHQPRGTAPQQRHGVEHDRGRADHGRQRPLPPCGIRGEVRLRQDEQQVAEVEPVPGPQPLGHGPGTSGVDGAHIRA